MNAPSDIQRFWLEAAADLGIEVKVQWPVTMTNGQIVTAEVLLPQFGSAKGMILAAKWEDLEAVREQLVADAYGFSIPRLLGKAYSRTRAIELLRDWSWAPSVSPAPDWLQQEDYRPLSVAERNLLNYLLAADFPGRDALARQIDTALGRRIDENGSIEFQVSAAPPAEAAYIPVEGSYPDGSDSGFGPAVNLLLFVVDGRAAMLEIYKDDGTPIVDHPLGVDTRRIQVHLNTK
jgi:hypothetical protein